MKSYLSNNKYKQFTLQCLFLITTGFVAMTTGSQAAETERSGLDMLDLYADFRYRFEDDWDSSRSSGALREDRARSRVRVRFGAKIKPNDNIEFGARIRTGNKNSQQSPHWTIGDYSGNSNGTHDVVFDKWYLKAKKDKLWAWVGRDGLPIWKQNEMLWDDDATVVGASAGIKNFELGAGKLSANTGYVALPDGMQHQYWGMGFGQVVYSTSFDNVSFTAAGGVLSIDGTDRPSKGGLQSGNKARDYSIWVANLQAKTKFADLPVSFGFDYMHNSEDYSVAELAGTPSGTTDDDVDGYVLQIRLGKNNKKGDWIIGYSYADIETLAVNSSYAQDDWMRWGSSTDTRGSDFHGHEVRVGYVLPWKWKVLARFYSVESNNNLEDGNRFRIDFNRKFW
jgi:Putative porin